jgi:acetyl-CoA acyltransferase
MTEVVILGAVRSAVGRAHKGSLAFTRPDEFAGDVVRALLAKVPSVKPEEVEDLVLGCAMPEGEQGLNVARVVGLLGGLSTESGGITINRFCSSGLQAIALGAGAILTGGYDAIVAGGVESMTMVPMTGNKLSASPEAMEKVASVYTPMGITAENVAKRYGISREDQDAFALWSQQKATRAKEARKFDDEIVPVRAHKWKGQERVAFEFKDDELIRPDTTAEGLASLKPAFAQVGSVTAGNSSPLSDGAAAALITSREFAEKHGAKPIGVFRHFVTVGVDPAVMGIGPVPAVRKLLAKSGLTIDQVDLVEMNEAFASQSVYCKRELGIPDDKLNVNGGAIALGHPLGCTGAKLVATALAELRRRGGKRAIVTMCIGGGMGAAGLIEAAY